MSQTNVPFGNWKVSRRRLVEVHRTPSLVLIWVRQSVNYAKSCCHHNGDNHHHSRRSKQWSTATVSPWERVGTQLQMSWIARHGPDAYRCSSQKLQLMMSAYQGHFFQPV